MTALITGLDHVTVLTSDLARAVDDVAALLGRAVAWRSDDDGASTAIFTVGNMALELLAPAGTGAAGARVRAALDQRGEGLASICFRVTDLDRMVCRLERLALRPEPVTDARSINSLDGAVLRWRRTRIPPAAARGVRLFFLQRDRDPPQSSATTPSAAIGLDHLVVTTHDADGAAALYGARLGLDMRLDVTRPAWGARLMFFRCGDAVVELAQRLGDAGAGGVDTRDDTLMGLSWRVADADAARRRLSEAAFDVSEVRLGRKPGTRIFTVRSRTGGVPTLMIEPSTRRHDVDQVGGHAPVPA